MTNGSPASDASRAASATAAARLADAVATRRPCAPVRELCDAVDEVAWAYAVQRQFVAAAWPGEVVSGRKIGLTSPAVQAQLGVDQPDFGTLFASMALPSGAVVTDEFLQPRIEGEIAFLLGSDLGAGGGELTLDDVRAAVTGSCAAIEICDSRIEGWDISLVDTVADNASAGGYVLAPTWVPLADVEPREATMTMTVTGHEEPITGEGSACLGDPLEAVLWLARTCARLGDPLRAGEVVLSGALAPMAPLDPGTRVRVEVSGLGSVEVSRADDAGAGGDGGTS